MAIISGPKVNLCVMYEWFSLSPCVIGIRLRVHLYMCGLCVHFCLTYAFVWISVTGLYFRVSLSDKNLRTNVYIFCQHEYITMIFVVFFCCCCVLWETCLHRDKYHKIFSSLFLPLSYVLCKLSRLTVQYYGLYGSIATTDSKSHTHIEHKRTKDETIRLYGWVRWNERKYT